MAMEEQDAKIRQTAKEAADKYHIKVMRESAGKDLFARLDEFFGGTDLAMPWFYSPNSAWDGRTPYQVCLASEGKRVRKAIDDMNFGVFF